MYFRKNPIPKTNTKRIRPIIYFRSQKPNQFRTPIWKDPFLLGIGPKISEQGPTPWKPRTPPPPVERPAEILTTIKSIMEPARRPNCDAGGDLYNFED